MPVRRSARWLRHLSDKPGPQLTRDLAIVAAVTLLAFAPFWGKALHVDEPFFLDLVKRLAADPLGEAAAVLGGSGTGPGFTHNNNPPILLLLMSAAHALTGGSVWAMRMALFPLDLMASLSLYLLASRWLKKPLLPVLIVIASPAYLINLNHLMAEKPAAALGFACLWALTRGVDDKRPGGYWLSAMLLGLALLSKYIAVFLFPTAIFYAWRRGVPARRICLYTALAASPLALYLAIDSIFLDGGVLRGVFDVSRLAAAGAWSHPLHRLRSAPAFLGGLAGVALLWPFLARPRYWWLILAAAAVLYSPLLDVVPGVRGIDRFFGVWFAAGAMTAIAGLFDPDERRRGGWPLWTPWILSMSALLLVYWSIMARVALFALPPLVFAMAGRLESRLRPEAWRKISWASFAAVLALGLASALVDYRYADSQRTMARLALSRETSGRVWNGGHLGLRHYLLEGGASEFEQTREGWKRLRRGDILVTSRTNAHLRPPAERILVNTEEFRVESRIPVRLISIRRGEGGFYSNISGFLPFAFSREPLEEFTLIEVL